VLRPDHAVLHGPLGLGSEPEVIPTPANFKALVPTLADELATYRIFPEPQPIGGAMTAHVGFEDAPDAEVIAGGIHLRHPDSPVIARHGAFVMWGFEGPPDKMTAVGRRLLLNVVAYASAHRGERPVVRVLAPAREFVPRPAEDLPYVFVREGRSAVDGIARQLGTPNNFIELLRAVACRLKADAYDADALVVLARYCPQAPVSGFAAWLAANEADLFFSDWGGYRWYSRRSVVEATTGQRSSR